jgi:hypothetical protein
MRMLDGLVLQVRHPLEELLLGGAKGEPSQIPVTPRDGAIPLAPITKVPLREGNLIQDEEGFFICEAPNLHSITGKGRPQPRIPLIDLRNAVGPKAYGLPQLQGEVLLELLQPGLN